ncbi:hypothetical protein BC941DRAFT_262705 [Chlamydoabsidia padenii]|nr:hypothetical protein BC941DRAFT_262705 [Chlamydoabsidia padenii]
MKDSLFKLFSSVRLVQEVSRSTTSPSSSGQRSTSIESTLPSNFIDHHSRQLQTPLSSTSQPIQSHFTTATHDHNHQDSSTDLTFALPVTGINSTTKSADTHSSGTSSSSSSSPPNGYRGRQSKYSTVRQHRFPTSPLISHTLPLNTNDDHVNSNHYSTPNVNIQGMNWRPSTPLISSSSSSSSSQVRQQEQQQQKQQQQGMKSKSHKLLCLWPLPAMTRYTILISALISTLNACQVIQLTCSSPKYVIFRYEIINLLLSPFLFDFTLHSLVLFGWNVLILGLFEESLSQSLGGTRRFFRIVSSIVLVVCTIRQGVGYLFSRSTGWALPTLFFSDSIHECNQGLVPFLFALLIIQSVSIDDKYILIFGNDEDSNYKLTIRKVSLQLAMLLVNYTVKNILWWSLTGLLTGYMATLLIQTTCLAREEDGHYYLTHPTDDQEQQTAGSLDGGSMMDEKQAMASSWNGLLEPYRRTPLWRLLWSAVKRGTLVMMITLPLLLICNAYYTREHFVDELTLNELLNKDPYLFSFVIMTAPRRGDPPFLTQTLQSYLDQWPLLPPSDDTTFAIRPSLYDRIQVFVYTHFSNHAGYDRAFEQFAQDPKGQRYIKWIREPGDVWNHRLHISSALQHATANDSSAYVALLEDDFPICGRHAWREIENVIYEANIQVPGHCGVFVGTGGSGLFLKPDIATLVSRLLLQYTDIPPDIVIQKCLLGELDECRACSQTLVASKTLLMHHIGFNASTSEDRKYKKNEFQCGWRHPFNGDPDVITL